MRKIETWIKKSLEIKCHIHKSITMKLRKSYKILRKKSDFFIFSRKFRNVYDAVHEK